jgi:hypothetical protein
VQNRGAVQLAMSRLLSCLMACLSRFGAPSSGHDSFTVVSNGMSNLMDSRLLGAASSGY